MEKAIAKHGERLDYLSTEMNRILKNNKNHNQENDLFEQYVDEYYELLESFDWLDVVFEENGKKGLKNIKGEVVIPPIYDDYCILEPYYKKNLFGGAIIDGKAALVKRDGTGTPITDFEFHHIERIEDSTLYACWKSSDLKHFALMSDGQLLTPFELESYGEVCDGCLIVSSNGKNGIVAIDQGLIYISPSYDEIIDQGADDYFLFIKDGVKGFVTLDKRFIPEDEFKNIDDEEHDNLMNVGLICNIY